MPEFKQKALIYCEQHGIIEHAVNGHLLEYLSFYGSEEGWVYVVVNLAEAEPREIYRKQAFPWMGFIPYFLKGKHGGTEYNYYEG